MHRGLRLAYFGGQAILCIIQQRKEQLGHSTKFLFLCFTNKKAIEKCDDKN